MIAERIQSTKMSKQKPSLMVPTAEEYVRQAIRTIGITDTTFGYWTHEILGFLMVYVVPQFVVNMVFERMRQRRLKKE